MDSRQGIAPYTLTPFIGCPRFVRVVRLWGGSSSAAHGSSKGARDPARRRDEVAARRNVGEGLAPSEVASKGV